MLEVLLYIQTMLMLLFVSSVSDMLRMPAQDIRASQEDLTVMIRRQSQRAQNIFGEDKNKRRRTAMSRDMENLVSPEIIAHKKKTALERTLKVSQYLS